MHSRSAAVAGAGGAEAPQRADVVVAGAGVIGLSVAWQAATAGLGTVVVDPEPARGASWAAAGMLAPVTELHYGEQALFALTTAAARRWDSFAAALAAVAGPVGYQRCGTLLVALDRSDRAWVEELFAFQQQLGLDVEWLAGRQARTLEPALAPVSGAVWAPGDHQVHTRQLLAALLAAATGSGVTIVRRSVEAVELEAGAVAGARLDSGHVIRSTSLVMAAGCRSGHIAGLPSDAVPEVRPVKGQILRLGPRVGAAALGRSVRAVAQGASVYLVPRLDGSLVVGSTVEEQGFDTTVTAGAVYELLRDARAVVPSVAEMVLSEASAGLRPGSPDNGPLVGPVDAVPGLVLATGHYRNGVLLAPVTADAVCATLTGGATPSEMAAFSPGRFVASHP